MDPIQTRLAALAELQVLDTAPEGTFDSLAQLTAEMFAAPVALITLLDADRQWFKAAVGVEVRETPLAHSFCAEGLKVDDAVFEVPDALADPRFATNPLVTGRMQVRYYAGASIRAPNGVKIGSLCVIDRKARTPMTVEERHRLVLLAEAVTNALTLRMELIAREAAEARLAESEARYRHLANHCHDILLRADPQGVILYASPSCRSLGYFPEDVVGRNLVDFVADTYKAEVVNGLRNMFADGLPDEAVQPAYPALNRAGETVWLEGASTIVRDHHGVAREMVSIYRDVSEQVALKARLEAAVEAKSAFLANMSHELRTPLTSILGFSALLAQTEGLPDAAAAHVQRIAASGEALLALINDVLDVSKLEAGQIELEPTPTAIGVLACEVRDMLSAQAQVKGIDLEVRSDLEHGTRRVDGLRLRQILVNLAGNAVKFTERGSVRIQLSELGQDLIRIEVLDTGPGLPLDHRTRLFRRFAQADSSITRQHGGTGLGLAISAELVELMGGTIGAENRPGSGARFWLDIPAPVCAPETSLPDAAEPVDPTSLSGRVLIVDDHPVNRELVRLILEGPDVVSVEAEHGRHALERALREPFDLILMDVNMPVMDGLAAASAIRASCPLNAETPIVALTAQTGDEIVDKCFAAGMDAVLAKPIWPQDLMRLASEVLGAQRPLAGAA